MLKQLKDDGGAIIPLLGYKTAGAITVPYTAVTANTISLAKTIKIITVTATTNCYVEFSFANVVATAASHYFIGGLPYDIAVGQEAANTSLSVLGVTDAGTLYISERG